jgi:hypothetical protein
MVQLFYVDDCVAAAQSDAEVRTLLASLADIFPLRILGEPRLFLGTTVTRDRTAGTLKLSQETYTRQLLLRFRMESANPAPVPLPPGTKLVKEGAPLPPGNRYPELVGCLMYLACGTRPDIAYAVHSLTRFMQAPTAAHWQAATYVLRYLVGTVNVGITYGGANSPGLAAGLQVHCDADFAADTTASKSTSGYIISINGGAVAWGSKLQGTAAFSTCEAEYQACSTVTKEVLWLRHMLPDFGCSVEGPVTIYNDNQGALAQIANPQSSHRSRHINLAHHICRERQARGEVSFRYCSTAENIADCFTKPLAAPALLRCLAGFGVA